MRRAMPPAGRALTDVFATIAHRTLDDPGLATISGCRASNISVTRTASAWPCDYQTSRSGLPRRNGIGEGQALIRLHDRPVRQGRAIFPLALWRTTAGGYSFGRHWAAVKDSAASRQPREQRARLEALAPLGAQRREPRLDAREPDRVRVAQRAAAERREPGAEDHRQVEHRRRPPRPRPRGSGRSR